MNHLCEFIIFLNTGPKIMSKNNTRSIQQLFWSFQSYHAILFCKLSSRSHMTADVPVKRRSHTTESSRIAAKTRWTCTKTVCRFNAQSFTLSRFTQQPIKSKLYNNLKHMYDYIILHQKVLHCGLTFFLTTLSINLSPFVTTENVNL